ncbi:thiamine pyrophosphate-dependent dehydrogenase E1 component subunit alpha [Microbacterium sp. 179-I 3D3 NHS]|uniref:thiamine pyrophosphate-dependent dehydrogenase E1 component subunit alpha n=1 Tax=unclassified Microbacterium TaxID=2609290 RepID=UPI00399F8440
MTTWDEIRLMVFIRRFEEALAALKTAGEIPGSIHLCNGQEAIPVGVARVLRADDPVAATYRGHGWALARGVDPAQIFAELMGRGSALSGGRAGSPYFSDRSRAFLGENSIVGAGVPIAAGAALSAARLATGAVAVVSIGDGATNQGAVHETLNLAAVLDLPLVVVVENNVYSEMTPIDDMVRVSRLAVRGDGYGIPAVTIDGNDADAVADAAGAAVERARSGAGPTLIEARTVRLQGHYSGDVQHYRDREELARALVDEPLARIRRERDAAGDGDRLDALYREVDDEIAGHIAHARSIALPDPEEVTRHVHA